MEEIGERITIKGGKEIVARFEDNFGQAAHIRDNTAIAFDVEAFHRLGRPFGITHHLADVDLGRIARQFDAATLAAVALDEAAARQIMYDLDQMVTRNA